MWEKQMSKPLIKDLKFFPVHYEEFNMTAVTSR
jgi:hypothetical protein